MIRFDERNQRWRWEFDRKLSVGADSVRVRKSRLLPKGVTREQAEALAGTMEAEEYVKRRLVRAASGWPEYVAEQLAQRRSWLHQTIAGCRGRSTARGRTLGITADQLATIMLRSMGRCEVTGIAFQLHKADGARARPFYHSLDRIDASQGYVNGNCRLVCYAVNLAMSNWGEDVFAQIATGFVVNKYCALGLTQHALTTPDFLVKNPRTMPGVSDAEERVTY